MSSNQSIPDGLLKTANGRDFIPLKEASYSVSAQPQTLRKHLCLYGHFHGAKPIKIGGRILFAVEDIAKLMKGESL